MIDLLDALIVYSESRKNSFVKLHPRMVARTFVANNTLDTATNISSYEKYTTYGTAQLKSELGLNSKYILIFVGRMRESKRIDLLVSAFKLLKSKYDISLVCIGAGMEREQLLNTGPIENLFLPGDIHGVDKVGKYLAISDIMVIPGSVGLSIVHGFSFGLPIVTCRSTQAGPYHAPEIEYLVDGCNGLYADSDATSIASCIEKLILNPKLLAQMKENALQTAKGEASIDRMVDGFKQAIEFVSRHGKMKQMEEGTRSSS